MKQATKDGKDVSQMIFDSGAEYASFMDHNFDNVAVTKTSGHLIVLITDKLCIGSKKDASGNLVPKCWGGYGHFPHWVNPFSRKRGITILATKDQYTFAHELGHIFGLKHTFEPYVGFNLQCNDPYKPKGRPAGECNSCANGKILYDPNGDPSGCNGPTNIMDYCTSKTGNEFFNACQEERAANQRQSYMTDSGETNYFKLKGLAGEEIVRRTRSARRGVIAARGLPITSASSASHLAMGAHGQANAIRVAATCSNAPRPTIARSTTIAVPANFIAIPASRNWVATSARPNWSTAKRVRRTTSAPLPSALNGARKTDRSPASATRLTRRWAASRAASTSNVRLASATRTRRVSASPTGTARAATGVMSALISRTTFASASWARVKARIMRIRMAGTIS